MEIVFQNYSSCLQPIGVSAWYALFFFFFRGEALYQCSLQAALHILISERMGIYHPTLPGRVHTLPLRWRCCLSGGVNPTTNLSL